MTPKIEPFSCDEIELTLGESGWDLADRKQVRLHSLDSIRGATYILSGRVDQICVLLVTSSEADPHEAKDQARELARKNRIPFVILSNGIQHWIWNVSRKRVPEPVRISRIPSPVGLVERQKEDVRRPQEARSDLRWATGLGVKAIVVIAILGVAAYALPQFLGTEEVCGTDYEQAAMHLFSGVAVALADQDASDAPNELRDEPRIAFSSQRDGNWEIYVMNFDGSNPTRLTFTEDLNEDNPTWSRDGSKIAYSAHFYTELRSDIFVVNADGSGQSRVTDSPSLDWYPTWSPDGSRIAFASSREGSYELFVVNTDGTNLKRITDPGGNWDLMPRWSPDSDLVTYTTFPGSGRRFMTGIAVTDVTGSNVKRLSMTPHMEDEPDWSPDGENIAFVTSQENKKSICVMNADGTNWQRVTFGDDSYFQPTWSPDGSKIAFTSNRDGRWQIYVVDRDGTNYRRLTDTAGNEKMPAWSPR